MPSTKQGGINYRFLKVFGITQPGIEPRSPGGLVGRVLATGPGDRGSIPGRVIPKTQKKWYSMLPCLTLSIISYGSRVKWSNPGKGVAPSLTRRCSSY